MDLPEIDFIATGVNHMLAISRFNVDTLQNLDPNTV
jgi:hypothetical protein